MSRMGETLPAPVIVLVACRSPATIVARQDSLEVSRGGWKSSVERPAIHSTYLGLAHGHIAHSSPPTPPAPLRLSYFRLALLHLASARSVRLLQGPMQTARIPHETTLDYLARACHPAFLCRRTRRRPVPLPAVRKGWKGLTASAPTPGKHWTLPLRWLLTTVLEQHTRRGAGVNCRVALCS